MYNIQDINRTVSPESIVRYLCQSLSTTSEKVGNQWEIKSQGGLYVDESGRIAKPADGSKAGGKGILCAAVYVETGGKWDADKDTFKRCLDIAAQQAGINKQIPSRIKRTPPKEKPPIDFNHPTKIYSYVDETGKELYQNCRYEWNDNQGTRQKTFRQRVKKDNKWIWNLNGTRRVPYNLLELMEEPHMFFDCEGEKDVETLSNYFTATNIGKEKESWKHFKHLGNNKLVIVCEDNDTPGKNSARERAAFWYSSGAHVKILTFHDMPEKSDVTDWIKAGNDPLTLPTIINSLPLFSPVADITIDFNFTPKERAPLITIQGRTFLETGNIAGIISGIGRGKSHLIEMFAALAVNPECEPYAHLDVVLKDGERVAIVDTERTQDDCYYGLKRIFRRLENKIEYLTADHTEIKQIIFTTMTDIPSPAERRNRLLQIFEMPSVRMIFIDGLLDFVGNPNDTEQNTEFITWLHAMCIRHDVGVLYTIHGNRNDNSGKGKGWSGDVAQRKSSGFLMLIVHPKFPDIRVLTSDFDNRKIRHGKDTDINLAMAWDDDLNAFRFIPYDAEENISNDTVFGACFAQAGKKSLSHKELCKYYKDVSGKSLATAKRHIDEALKTSGCLIKRGPLYQLNDNEIVF